MRFRFGDCDLDTETRELVRGRKPVHLSPKAFQLLELLIRERPRALSKKEIHKRLWSGTFVTDGTLTSLIAEMRGAINDDGKKSVLVRTVYRFGYAFSGDVEVEKEGAPRKSTPRFVYRLFSGPREIAIEEGETVLGRDPTATVFVDHASVSRLHARIETSMGKATIEDLGSKNGTRVGEERIASVVPLSDGDPFRLGSVRFEFRVFPLSGSTRTASRS
jgi:DNA-binding winged helix-turn-helix (wHTH) protein